MVVDSSAVIAILRLESDASVFAQALETADSPKMSTATFLETSIAVEAKRLPELSLHLEDFMDRAGISFVPFSYRQSQIARAAFRRYGRGAGHPAGLNFGDCFSYALAIDLGESLLFKGDDFGFTDVRNALAEPDS